MLHPSYTELMEKINKEVNADEPLVQSRYSLVIASAKRARQITDIEERQKTGDPKNKPLSQAVKQLYDGEVRILSEEEAEEEAQKLEELRAQMAPMSMAEAFEETEEVVEDDEDDEASDEETFEASDEEEDNE